MPTEIKPSLLDIGALKEAVSSLQSSRNGRSAAVQPESVEELIVFRKELIAQFQQEEIDLKDRWLDQFAQDLATSFSAKIIIATHKDTNPQTHCVLDIDKDTHTSYAFQDYSLAVHQKRDDRPLNDTIGLIRVSLRVDLTRLRDCQIRVGENVFTEEEFLTLEPGERTGLIKKAYYAAVSKDNSHANDVGNQPELTAAVA